MLTHFSAWTFDWTRLNIELNWTSQDWIKVFPVWIELAAALRSGLRADGGSRNFKGGRGLAARPGPDRRLTRVKLWRLTLVQFLYVIRLLFPLYKHAGFLFFRFLHFLLELVLINFHVCRKEYILTVVWHFQIIVHKHLSGIPGISILSRSVRNNFRTI